MSGSLPYLRKLVNDITGVNISNVATAPYVVALKELHAFMSIDGL